MWQNFLFKPTHPFKVKWDLLIILLAIWNSVEIPYQFAYPTAFDNLIGFSVSDYFIDGLFGIDVIINFRSAYKDPRTDEYILDPKRIAINYIKGRFWIDLLATLPLDSIIMLFTNVSSKNLKFFGMLKLVRLLRLGRLVTYLKMN
jgi:hypothetical protein